MQIKSIQMSKIKPASNELRESYDKDSLRNLQWSLMEEGQVEPIKVSQNGNDYYEIVYGHRRYFAAQNAGWDEIVAIVVDKDEVDNLIQAGIENLAKEDLSIMEKATWAERLVEMGMSNTEIGRKSTISNRTIDDWMFYKNMLNMGFSCPAGLPYKTVIYIGHGVGLDDRDGVNAILKRVSEANYGKRQAQALAQAYKHTDTPELKEQVLKTGVGKNDTWEDVLHKARFEKATQDRFPETFVFKPEWERDLMSNEHTHPYVKKFFGSLNSARRHILLGPLFVEQEVYKPDEAKATILKIDQTIGELEEYKQSLRLVTNGQ